MAFPIHIPKTSWLSRNTKPKDGKEIDFLIVKNDTPFMLVKVKLAEDRVSVHLSHFGQYFPGIKKVQLVKDLKRENIYPDGVEIRMAASWPSAISFDALTD